MLKYKRVLLKLSGEALAGNTVRGQRGSGIDGPTVEEICAVIKKCAEDGAEIAIMVGGGNFWRGARDGGGKIERFRADQMGMLATVINSLALCDAFEKLGVPARVMTALAMPEISEQFTAQTARMHLEKGRVIIIGCGTGNPYFSTDTGAVLRAAEIGADIVLMAKNVDGVYSGDPAKDPAAVRCDRHHGGGARDGQ